MTPFFDAISLRETSGCLGLLDTEDARHALKKMSSRRDGMVASLPGCFPAGAKGAAPDRLPVASQPWC
jgi:hypothetical protein